MNDSEDVCRRLNEMIIVDDSRSNCKAEDDWLDKIACKYGVKNWKDLYKSMKVIDAYQIALKAGEIISYSSVN